MYQALQGKTVQELMMALTMHMVLYDLIRDRLKGQSRRKEWRLGDLLDYSIVWVGLVVYFLVYQKT